MADQVNTDGDWVGVRELAELKGVSAAAISKRLKKFVEAEQIDVRLEGGKKLVRLAQWDFVTKENTDPAKLVGRDTTRMAHGDDAKDDDESLSDTSREYREQQARKMRLEADKRDLELAELVGALVPRDQAVAAMEMAAEKIVQQIDQLPSYADELAGAVSRGGAAGLKEALKSHSRRMRAAVAASMTLEQKDEDE